MSRASGSSGVRSGSVNVSTVAAARAQCGVQVGGEILDVEARLQDIVGATEQGGIEAKALRKLRHPTRSRRLKAYTELL